MQLRIGGYERIGGQYEASAPGCAVHCCLHVLRQSAAGRSMASRRTSACRPRHLATIPTAVSLTLAGAAREMGRRAPRGGRPRHPPGEKGTQCSRQRLDTIATGGVVHWQQHAPREEAGWQRVGTVARAEICGEASQHRQYCAACCMAQHCTAAARLLQVNDLALLLLDRPSTMRPLLRLPNGEGSWACCGLGWYIGRLAAHACLPRKACVGHAAGP